MIDEIDRKLVQELQRVGRMSFHILSKKLGTSPSSVARRVGRLIGEDAIRVVAVQPDPEQAGQSTVAIIGLKIKSGKIDDVCTKLTALDRVVFAGLSYGHLCVIISFHVNNPKVLLDLVKNKLSIIGGIHDIETFYIAEVKKRTAPETVNDREQKNQKTLISKNF